MQFNQIAMLVAAVLALAACQQESAPSIAAQSTNSAAALQAVVAKSSPAISVDPASMKGCDSIVATVQWDAAKAGVSTSDTEIWTGPSDTDTKLFSAGGAAGTTKTGPWSQPGTHFILKNKQDGKVLGEAVIGGPACH